MALLWAKSCPPPDWLKRKRPRGAKAKGIAYEKALARALPQAIHGQWFIYALEDGVPRWCQTDFLLQAYVLGTSYGLILECKLSHKSEAEAKLQSLYLPVARMALGGLWRGAQICRSLPRGWNEPVARNVREAGEWAATRHAVLLWHPKILVPLLPPISPVVAKLLALPIPAAHNGASSHPLGATR